MDRFKKTWIVLFLFCCTALCLVSCGKSEDNNPSTTIPPRTVNPVDTRSGSPSEVANPAKVNELISQGDQLFQDKNYSEALEKYNDVFDLDPQNATAHYAYAKSLGALMLLDYPTWFDHKKEALDHLQSAKKIKPDLVETIRSDPFFSKLHTELDYYKILGLSTNKTQDVKQILSSLTWYVQGQGAYTILGKAQFLDNGTLMLSYYDMKNMDKGVKEFKYTGRYTVNGSNVELKLDKPMLRKRSLEDIYENDTVLEKETVLRGELTNNGELKIGSFNYSFYYWYDEFSA